jgi:hypothetical protein
MRPASPADDVHRRATDWINRFGATEPPRDVAVHARYCDECQRAIRAVDLLLNVDVGRAALPAVEPIPIPARPLAPRLVVGGASLFVLIMAGLTVMDGMQTIATASPTPAQEVLGGGGSPVPSPLPQDEGTADATRSPNDPTPPPGPPLITPPPSFQVGPSFLPGSTLPGLPTGTEPPPSASADATRAPISPSPTSAAPSPSSEAPSPSTEAPSPSSAEPTATPATEQPSASADAS